MFILPIKVYCGNLLLIYILTLKSPIASAMDFLLVLVALTNSCPTDLLITAASGGEPPSESSLARRICCLNHQTLQLTCTTAISSNSRDIKMTIDSDTTSQSMMNANMSQQ